MTLLMNCGICCMCISVWGVIQLTLMGVFFKIEVLALVEDVCPLKGEYNGYDDFMNKTSENYNTAAINCWICAVVYFITLLLSIHCIRKAKKKASLEAKRLEDDEYVCQPKPHEIPLKLIKKMKKENKPTKQQQSPSITSDSKKKKSKSDGTANDHKDKEELVDFK